MKYTVIWNRKSLQKLAELWASAFDRNALTETADRIDAELQTHPLDVGESREGDTRILIDPPLCVTYRVDAAALRVHVWAVWLSKSP